MSPARLSNFAGIVLRGADAHRFAQSQFSGNVEQLAPGRWQWNAWLSVQGKVRLLMHLIDPGDDRLIALARGGDAGDACTTLARYLLRADLTLTLQAYAGYAAAPAPLGSTHINAGVITLGYGERSLELRPIVATDAEGLDPVATRLWRLADIRSGWPSLPSGEARWWPPALGLEHLGAVAFDKGCYPGQEVTARLHYRGGHKLALYHLHGPANLPSGPFHDGLGNAIEILDCVADDGGFALLAIAPDNYNNAIMHLDDTYKVISRFDA